MGRTARLIESARKAKRGHKTAVDLLRRYLLQATAPQLQTDQILCLYQDVKQFLAHYDTNMSPEAESQLTKEDQ